MHKLIFVACFFQDFIFCTVLSTNYTHLFNRFVLVLAPITGEKFYPPLLNSVHLFVVTLASVEQLVAKYTARPAMQNPKAFFLPSSLPREGKSTYCTDLVLNSGWKNIFPLKPWMRFVRMVIFWDFFDNRMIFNAIFFHN